MEVQPEDFGAFRIPVVEYMLSYNRVNATSNRKYGDFRTAFHINNYVFFTLFHNLLNLSKSMAYSPTSCLDTNSS